jgi:predicted nucleotidyltransferase
MPSGIQQRLERLLELARADERIVAAATTGSLARGDADEHSDVDVAFAVEPPFPLDEWTAKVGDVVHWWDLPWRTAVYRVFLLADGSEVNIAFVPPADFAARGPGFRLEFGDARPEQPPPAPDERFVVGLCWHHAKHARTAIERGRLWQAEHWLHELRDQLVELECLRAGLPHAEARGVDRLPQADLDALALALPRAVEAHELRRALGAAVAFFSRREPELAALVG